jgi:hypothetical protein
MGKAPKATKTETGTDTCRCGCGETVNPKRFFRQGHDQRLISKLAADVVTGTGTGLGILQSGEQDIQYRIDRVTEYVSTKLSEALGRKFHSAAMNAWANENKRAAKQAPVEPTDRDRQVAESILALSDQDDDNLSAADPRELPDEASETQTNYALGAPVKVKVGRYTYDGFVHGMNQSGKVTAVRYTNKAGKEHTLATPKQINLV